MADFDFDELDKAVTGALGTTPNSSSNDDAAAVEFDEPAPVAEASVSLVEEAPAVVATTAAKTAPATRRSSGRFMDVVHPSSDMRTASAAASPVKREGLTVQPAVTPVSESSDAPSDELVDWSQPLESPFIADAKVEKRPLGGKTDTAVDFNALELLEAPDDPQIETHTMPDPIDFAGTLDDKAAEEVVETLEVVAAEAPVEPIEEVAIEEVAIGYGEGTFQEPDVATPTGPSSINQQYEEKPSTSPEPGSVYDTEAYHQPIAKVAKKKSGFWTILWIILLVISGGGVGAAVYFYVLPLL